MGSTGLQDNLLAGVEPLPRSLVKRSRE